MRVNPGAPEELAVPACCNTPFVSVKVSPVVVTSGKGKETPTNLQQTQISTHQRERYIVPIYKYMMDSVEFVE